MIVYALFSPELGLNLRAVVAVGQNGSPILGAYASAVAFYETHGIVWTPAWHKGLLGPVLADLAALLPTETPWRGTARVSDSATAAEIAAAMTITRL